MAYLPGVPDVGPAPVSPTPHMNNGTVGHAGATSIGHLARSVGKPGNTEHLGNIMPRGRSPRSDSGGGFTSVGGGNPAMHSMGHYGKKAPSLLGGEQITGGVDPTAHAGANMIRGERGVMRSHIREGGLGPGRMGTPGPSNTDYSMNSMDTE